MFASEMSSKSAVNWWMKYPLPSYWEIKKDPNSGATYFIDHKNKKTTWEDPRISEFSHFETKVLNICEKEKSKQTTGETSIGDLKIKRLDSSKNSQKIKKQRSKKSSSFSQMSNSGNRTLENASVFSSTMSESSIRLSKLEIHRKNENQIQNSRNMEKDSLSETKNASAKWSSSKRGSHTRHDTPLSSTTECDSSSQSSTTAAIDNHESEATLKSVPEDGEGNLENEDTSTYAGESNEELQPTQSTASDKDDIKDDPPAARFRSKLAEGPNQTFLSQRAPARGPDPHLVKGPNAALRKGPNPDNLRKIRLVDNAGVMHSSLVATLVT